MEQTVLPPSRAAAMRAAESLLRIGAVHFRPQDPFTLASGKPSPVYVDCRKIISFPDIRSEIADMMVSLVLHFENRASPFSNIAGGETAGIAFAAFVAERMGRPMTYVRKKPKGYGRNARIEGAMKATDKVLLVEDLATDGGTKIKFAEAIRETGAECRHAAVVLGYGIFSASERRLRDADLTLHHLCSMQDVVDCAEADKTLTSDALKLMREFLELPEEWQRRRM